MFQKLFFHFIEVIPKMILPNINTVKQLARLCVQKKHYKLLLRVFCSSE